MYIRIKMLEFQKLKLNKKNGKNTSTHYYRKRLMINNISNNVEVN